MIGLVLSPLRVVVRTVGSLPRAVEAILVLPTLVEKLEQVSADTEALHDILGELNAVRADTAALPHVHGALKDVHSELEQMRKVVTQVEANTLAVERLAEIAVPLQGAALRVGRLADRWPQRRIGNSDRRGLAPERDAGDDEPYAD